MPSHMPQQHLIEKEGHRPSMVTHFPFPCSPPSKARPTAPLGRPQHIPLPSLPAVSLPLGHTFVVSCAARLSPGHQSTIHQPVQRMFPPSPPLCAAGHLSQMLLLQFFAEVLISTGTECRAPPALNQTQRFCLEASLKVPQKTLFIA